MEKLGTKEVGTGYQTCWVQLRSDVAETISRRNSGQGRTSRLHRR